MRDSRNAVHHGFKRDGDLLLDLLRGDAGPLSDDIDVVVGNVGICLDGQPMEGDDAPGEQKNSDRQEQEGGSGAQSRPASESLRLQRCFKFQNIAHHLLAGRNAGKNLLLVAGQHVAGLTSTRLNLFPPAGTKTQSRSCRCRMAEEGMAANGLLVLLVKVAVTNMPSLRTPGFSTSMRTLAVRMLGSSTGPMSLTRPVSTLPG